LIEARAYEREFRGVTNFQPISRKHPAFVNILHVGRDERNAYFYCIMELADDGPGGPTIDAASYIPRTLAWEVDEYGPLRLDRCLEIALSLTDGLQYLHDQGLVHRDLKPANIIFANERWKLADIGLVKPFSETPTADGTPRIWGSGGPGKPLADIYSLGMVLYRISTGRSPGDSNCTESLDDAGVRGNFLISCVWPATPTRRNGFNLPSGCPCSLPNSASGKRWPMPKPSPAQL
jgi:serine/threonine protein kinase